MNITVTIQGDSLSPEIAQTLRALGVALAADAAAEPIKAPEGVKVISIQEPEEPAETAVKKTRKPKAAKTGPEPAAEEAPEETPEAEEPAVEEDTKAITLESLREKVVFLSKSGKTDAVRKLLAEFGVPGLSSAKKSDYPALDEKLSAL